VLDRLAASFLPRFFVRDKGYLADFGYYQNGVWQQNTARRPNQIFAVTLGCLPPAEARQVLAALKPLVVPGALRSLADEGVDQPLLIKNQEGRPLNDPYHPYFGRYMGEEDVTRKPAYHNGTAWVWPFPSYCEGLIRFGGSAGREEARRLLHSTKWLLYQGCLGQLPEILDGDAPHVQRGCDAQAWSVTEVFRVLELLEQPFRGEGHPESLV
jgi:glycogen debranching enzyme